MYPLLQVRDLSVRFDAKGTPISAVRGVSFDIDPGEVVGVLGESGGGKTTLALALMQLLPESGRILGGSIRFRGREFIGLADNQLRHFRGAELAIVQQDPTAALNPVMRVSAQISNVIRAHRNWSRGRCRAEAESLLAQVGLAGSPRILDAYPHELSSGQKQRVAIAQALSCRPALLIADEPTANLDSSTEAEIFAIFRNMQAHYGTAFLFITHNPALLAGFADRVMVMYAGEVVELGELLNVYARPLHPHTASLLQAMPSGRNGESARPVVGIPGNPPDLAQPSSGCSFEPRCARRTAVCGTQPPAETGATARQSLRSFRTGDVQ